MSNGPPKKTKVRRLAKILGAVVLLVIGFLVSVNIKADNTPLHRAARKNATETAQLLLTWGANVNAKNSAEADTTALGGVEKCNRNSPTLTDPRSRDLRQGHIGPDAATLGGVEQRG